MGVRPVNLKERTVLVTGTDTGIGFSQDIAPMNPEGLSFNYFCHHAEKDMVSIMVQLRSFSHLLKDTSVITNTVNSGLCATEMSRDLSRLAQTAYLSKMIWSRKIVVKHVPLFRSASATSVFLGCSATKGILRRLKWHKQAWCLLRIANLPSTPPMKRTFWDFLRDQRTLVTPNAPVDLQDQTVAIIGANTGIGFAAAKEIAQMKPGRLILACRSEERGKAAIAKLTEETGYSTAELWLLDLSKISSVIEFANKFEKDGGRLDILIANAGIATTTYQLTSDGWEEALQVNVIATGLLCLLLSPRLVETSQKFPGARPRTIITTSEGHFDKSFDNNVLNAPSPFQALNTEEYYIAIHKKDPTARYAETKLLGVFLAQALSDLLSDTPVLVNSVNPGLCRSEISRNLAGVPGFFFNLLVRVLGRTEEDGGRQLVWASVGGSEDINRLKGAYINSQAISEASDYVLGEEGKKRQNKLWADLVNELSKVDSRVQAIVSSHSP